MLPLEPDLKPASLLRIHVLRALIIVAAVGAVALALLGSPWLSQLLLPDVASASGKEESVAMQATATPTAFQPTTTVPYSVTPLAVALTTLFCKGRS